VASWYEDDVFWETWAPYLFSPDRLGNARRDVERLIELLGINPDSTVLDVCCGVGRHALELARRGFRVVGVDRTNSYIECCREAAKREAVDADFIVADAFSARLDGSFDVAINMFTSFGYYEDENRKLGLLKKLYSSLGANGKLLIQLAGKEVLARDFREHDWYTHEDGTLGLHKRVVRDGWGRLDSEWILIRADKLVWRGTLSYRIYAGTELRNMLYEAGFSEVNIYGSLAGIPYDHRAQELVAVAVK
jgi:SAM-dependent methyltransferase